MPNAEQMPVTLRDYLATLWSRRWLVVAVAIACFLGALFYSSRQTPIYVSSAEVLVLPVSVAVPGQGGSSFVVTDNELRIANSSEVSRIATDAIQREGSEVASISITSPGGTQTLVFTSRSPDPEAAQATAQAYAEAYLEFRERGLTFNVQKALESIDELITDLRDQVVQAQDALTNADSPSEIDVWRFRISSLESEIQSRLGQRADLELAGNVTVGQLLQEAFVPAAPSSPQPARAGTFGLLLGFALGIGLAFLWERLDQRVRSREDIETSAQVPVVGMIPRVRKVGPRLVMSPGGDPAATEAYRALRARVSFAASQEEIGSVLVTSPHQGEGKTTTAANLATALAQADKRVVLISGDLRLPTLERFFVHDPDGRGLSDILEGRAYLADAIVRTDVPNLWLIPSGTSDEIAGALGSPTMSDLIEQVAKDADMVIIDTPPVLQTSEALELAPRVDSVLLVVDPKRSNKAVVAAAADDLRSVGANVIGVVISNFDPEKFRSYERRRYYGYSPQRGREKPTKQRQPSLPDARS